MRVIIPILFVLGFLVIGCDSILGETEEVEAGIRCDQIYGGGAMLGYDVDTSISEICKDTCLRNVMKYSPDYRCHATSLKLICNCVVTPERKEQLKIIKEREEKSKLNSECEEICKSKMVCEDTPVNYEQGEKYDALISNDRGNSCVCRCSSNYPYPSFFLTGKLPGELPRPENPREVNCHDNVGIVETQIINETHVNFKLYNYFGFDVDITLSYKTQSKVFGDGTGEISVHIPPREEIILQSQHNTAGEVTDVKLKVIVSDTQREICNLSYAIS